MSEKADAAAGAEDAAVEYAIVEIFGHRQHAGRIEEVERFGSKMLRIDIPTDGDFEKGYVTLFYGGASIFSLTLTDLETVKRRNTRPSQPVGLLPRGRDDDDEILF